MTTTTSLTLATTIQRIVESTSEGCNLLSLALTCSYKHVAPGENVKAKAGEEFVGGNYINTNIPLVSMNCLSPFQDLFTIQLQE